MSRISYADIFENANPILKQFLEEYRQVEIANSLEFATVKEKVDAFNAKRNREKDMLLDIFGSGM